MPEVLNEFVEIQLDRVFNEAGKKDQGEKLDQEIDQKELPEEVTDLINSQVIYFAKEAYKAGLRHGLKIGIK